MNWSAKQYSAFENERTRPVRDLVAALPNERVARAVDLGCGATPPRCWPRAIRMPRSAARTIRRT